MWWGFVRGREVVVVLYIEVVRGGFWGSCFYGRWFLTLGYFGVCRDSFCYALLWGCSLKLICICDLCGFCFVGEACGRVERG